MEPKIKEVYVAFSIHNSNAFITANTYIDAVTHAAMMTSKALDLNGTKFTVGWSRDRPLRGATKLLANDLTVDGHPTTDPRRVVAFFRLLERNGWNTDTTRFCNKHKINLDGTTMPGFVVPQKEGMGIDKFLEELVGRPPMMGTTLAEILLPVTTEAAPEVTTEAAPEVTQSTQVTPPDDDDYKDSQVVKPLGDRQLNILAALRQDSVTLPVTISALQDIVASHAGKKYKPSELRAALNGMNPYWITLSVNYTVTAVRAA